MLLQLGMVCIDLQLRKYKKEARKDRIQPRSHRETNDGADEITEKQDTSEAQ
jgi:hypothetical protein